MTPPEIPRKIFQNIILRFVYSLSAPFLGNLPAIFSKNSSRYFPIFYLLENPFKTPKQIILEIPPDYYLGYISSANLQRCFPRVLSKMTLRTPPRIVPEILPRILSGIYGEILLEIIIHLLFSFSTRITKSRKFIPLKMHSKSSLHFLVTQWILQQPNRHQFIQEMSRNFQ